MVPTTNFKININITVFSYNDRGQGVLSYIREREDIIVAMVNRDRKEIEKMS